MQRQRSNTRRAPGAGHLLVKTTAAGREDWYGKWYADGRQVKRKIGPKRKPGERHGLTRAQAERQLRRMIEEAPAPALARMSVKEAGDWLLEDLEARGKKRSTVEGYRSGLDVHLAPFFAGRTLDAITAEDVEAFIRAKRRDGLATKSIMNYLGFLHSIFEFAVRKKRARSNPCKEIEKPGGSAGDPDIRFLDADELEAVLRHAGDDALGQTLRVMYLAAAMTGLRQGELIALRWRDVDWTAGRVRVRRNYARGEYGTPKSKRSSRSVPLADRLAGELERHFKSRYGEDAAGQEDALVLAHPVTGKPLDRSKVLKRFKEAVAGARVGQFEAVVRKNGRRDLRPLTRFHDLRHTFGTRMAAVGVPMRTLQEWMGHRDIKTTMIYADYAPSAHEAAWVERAFGRPGVTNGAGVAPLGE